MSPLAAERGREPMKDEPALVLVVDDDPVIRRLLEELLRRLGHRVETAASGAEALAKLERRPDLILLDLEMPELSGLETARRIRRHPVHGDVPMVIVTAHDSRQERLRAVEAGANDFISKPVDVTELRVRTDSLLQMKAARDVLKRHQRMLEELVRQRTASLQRALEELAAARQAAYEAQLETIHRLALAAEMRDASTAAHLRRVSAYAELLARRLQLPAEEVETLAEAAPLHDVGKVAIPEDILRKPGRLDRSEREVVEQHTVIGARLLSGSRSRLLQVGEVIALTHHERWDGAGYPRRLARDAIPLWGRICAVADVYDALTTARPYKPAYPAEQARQILREGRGSHFDPELVDLFLRDFDEVLAVQQSYA